MAVKILPKPSDFLHSRPPYCHVSHHWRWLLYLRHDWMTELTSRCVVQPWSKKTNKPQFHPDPFRQFLVRWMSKRKPLIQLFNWDGLPCIWKSIVFRLCKDCECCGIRNFLPEFMMFTHTNTQKFYQIPRFVILNVGKHLNNQINTFFRW